MAPPFFKTKIGTFHEKGTVHSGKGIKPKNRTGKIDKKERPKPEKIRNVRGDIDFLRAGTYNRGNKTKFKKFAKVLFKFRDMWFKWRKSL